jgi:hypothetical protein
MKKAASGGSGSGVPTIWSCHMPKGAASGMGSGIIMMAAMFGTSKIMVAA